MAIRMSVNSADMAKNLNKIHGQLSSFGSGLKAIGGMIAGTFAVSRIASFVKEVSTLAGQAEGVREAFNRLNKASLLEELRKATKGTVSDFELMKAAVSAKNFDIPLENMGKLLAFAHQRAKETGQSVDYLVNSIVMGIGRKSPLILDNLGISAVALRKEFKGIGMETANVGDIAEAVGRIIDREMKNAGDQTLTTAERTAQLKTQWENTKIEFGDSVNLVKNQLLPILMKAVQWVNKLFNPNADAKIKASELFADYIESIKGLGDELQQAKIDQKFLEIQTSLIAAQQAGKNTSVWNELMTLLKEYDVTLDNVSNSSKDAAENISKLNDEIERQWRLSKLKFFDRISGQISGTDKPILGTGVPTSVQQRIPDTQLYRNVQTPGIQYSSAWEAQWDANVAAAEEYAALMQRISDQITATMNNMFMEIAVGFGEMLGNLISSGEKFDAAAALNGIAGMLQQLGELAISAGLATLEIKTALDTLQGWGAIAAGVALVALAQAVRNSASNIASGGSASATMGSYEASQTSLSVKRNLGDNDVVTIKVEGKISGNDIRLSNVRSQASHQLGY